MREEWWLEQCGDVWSVVGYNPDNSLWRRQASDIEIALWQRWRTADRAAAQKTRLVEALRQLPRFTTFVREHHHQGGHYGEELWRSYEHVEEQQAEGPYVKWSGLTAAVEDLEKKP